MTRTADYVWLRWDEDNLLHAVLAEQAAGDDLGLIDAACDKVLTTANSAQVDPPRGALCPGCLVFVGTQVEDAQWRMM